MVLHIKVYFSLTSPLGQIAFQGCSLPSGDPGPFQFVAIPSGKNSFQRCERENCRDDTHSQIMLCHRLHRLLSRISHMDPLNCKCLGHVPLCPGKKGKLDMVSTNYLHHKLPELPEWLLQCG